MKNLFRSGLMLVLIVSQTILAQAGNWSRWRGPDGAGHTEGSGIPTAWTGDDYLWTVELPGIGHSSPVVWGDQVVVSSALQEDGTKIIQSLRGGDGRLLWEKRISVDPAILGNSTSHDKASPAVDSERVYLNWSSKDGYHVAALDLQSGERAVGTLLVHRIGTTCPVRRWRLPSGNPLMRRS